MDAKPVEHPLQIAVIAGHSILTDRKGRIYLEALHKASGGDMRHQPARWHSTRHAQGRIAVLASKDSGEAWQDVPVYNLRGAPHTGGGMYACKELALDYARWISPDFLAHFMRSMEPQLPAISSPEVSRLDTLKHALAAEKERIALLSEAGTLGAPLDAMGQIADVCDLRGLRKVARELHVSPGVLLDFLHDKGWVVGMQKRGVENCASSDKIRRGYLVHKVLIDSIRKGGERVQEEIMVTPKGLDRLDTMLRQQADKPSCRKIAR